MDGPRAGFLIVKTFETLYRAFPHPTPPDVSLYSVPQSNIEPAALSEKYRGIDREPIEGFPLKSMAGLIRDDPSTFPLDERAACLALHGLEEQGKADEDFVFALHDARDIYSLLGEPDKWEIIWAADTAARIQAPANVRLLGFEPTWFLGDHFSASCDCMFFPRWHGTDREGTLFVDYYNRTNEHGLFRSAEEAAAFLQFYLSQDWTETGDYVIAEVYELSSQLRGHLEAPSSFVVLPTTDQYPNAGSVASQLNVEGLTWDIDLTQVVGGRKIMSIKAIREITGMGLAQAKDLVESLPQTIRLVHIGEIQVLKDQLAQAGFVVEVRRTDRS